MAQGEFEPLHVVIVGAGLGGLAAAVATRLGGHRVTICEQAMQLGEVCFVPPFNPPPFNPPHFHPIPASRLIWRERGKHV